MKNVEYTIHESEDINIELEITNDPFKDPYFIVQGTKADIITDRKMYNDMCVMSIKMNTKTKKITILARNVYTGYYDIIDIDNVKQFVLSK